MAMAILPLFTLITVFVLLPVGVAVAVRGFRGTPVLSEPKCARCGYDLRGFAGAPPTRCSECGSDLTAKNAIRWGEYRRNLRLAAMGIGIFLIGPVLGVGLNFMRMRTDPMSPSRSTPTVLTSLKTSASAPWDWQELDRRLAGGTLSNADASAAIDTLIADLKKRTSQQPLTWSEGFVKRADSMGVIGKEQYVRLAQAFFGPAKVELTPRVRQGTNPRFSLRCGGPWRLPDVELVKALRKVSLADGRELHPISDNEANPRGKQHDPDYLSANATWEIDGTLPIDLQPGNFTLTFDVDVALLQPESAPHMVNDRPGQAKNWPPGRASWSEQVVVPLTVVGKDEAIPLLTDPALDPQKSGAVRVNYIRVTRAAGGKHRFDIALTCDGKHVPTGWEVSLRLAGKEQSIGSFISQADEAITNHFTAIPGRLDDATTTADLILRPKASLVQESPGIDRIWGSTIEFTDVPLKRFDIAATAPSPQQD